MTPRPTSIGTEPSQDDDAALVRAWRSGSEEAFSRLYERWRLPLWRYLRARAGVERADELHQETWMTLVQGIDRYEERAQFSGWLFTLARRAIIDDARRRARRAEADHEPLADDAGVEGDPLRDVADEENRRALASAVATLPDAQREIVHLRWYAGLGVSEVAEVLGAPRDTVKSRLRYALGHLRSALAEREETAEHE